MDRVFPWAGADKDRPGVNQTRERGRADTGDGCDSGAELRARLIAQSLDAMMRPSNSTLGCDDNAPILSVGARPCSAPRPLRLRSRRLRRFPLETLTPPLVSGGFPPWPSTDRADRVARRKTGVLPNALWRSVCAVEGHGCQSPHRVGAVIRRTVAQRRSARTALDGDGAMGPPAGIVAPCPS
jgi:hypothetical protein